RSARRFSTTTATKPLTSISAGAGLRFRITNLAEYKRSPLESRRRVGFFCVEASGSAPAARKCLRIHFDLQPPGEQFDCDLFHSVFRHADELAVGVNTQWGFTANFNPLRAAEGEEPVVLRQLAPNHRRQVAEQVSAAQSRRVDIVEESI